MSDLRIKGQEVEVLIVANGVVQQTVTDIRSFELGVKMEILSEGFLGEKSDRKDDVFRGCRFRMELHHENQDALDLILAIIARAQRQTPGAQFNIKVTLNYPNGQRPRVILQNAFFGEIPMGFAGRTDYGTVTLEGEVGGAFKKL